MRGRRLRRGLGLPAQPGPLIGRERELQLAEQMFATADVRLLTITGPPGAGKTRLALAVAAKLASTVPENVAGTASEVMRGRAPDAVWFVDLAPIHDARLLPTAIGRAAGVRE